MRPMPERPLRVHVLISSLTWGGAETLLADFARGAADAGLQVSVGYLSTESQAAGKLRKIGIEPELIEVTSLLSRSDRRRVRDHIATRAPDLLHTHLGGADFLGGLAARSLGIPAISTLHVMDGGGPVRERAKTRLIGLVRRSCLHRVIAVSEAARRHYLATSWDRPEHVVTVHNGIADRVRAGSGQRIRDELGISPEDLVIVMLGVLRVGKGHEVAVDAVTMLRERFPNLRLLILGDGPERPAVERAAARIGEAAILAGYRDDVLDVLDAADILLHPSSIDAFPTALIEAMAARVPVVATAVGGIPEIVVPGETGILIDAPPDAQRTADALQLLLTDPALRRDLAAAGRRRFEERFTVSRWISRLLEIYDEALVAAG
jgi:glycosyltransferase involved in cell wall biosynthesis